MHIKDLTFQESNLTAVLGGARVADDAAAKDTGPTPLPAPNYYDHRLSRAYAPGTSELDGGLGDLSLVRDILDSLGV